MTLADANTDLFLLESLEEDIPCEGAYHLLGEEGHDPQAPAAYFIVPPCGCDGLFACAARVEWLQSRMQLDIECRCRRKTPVEAWRFVPIA